MLDMGNLFFTGNLVHIVGTNIDCHGHCCSQHAPCPCGSALRVDDWVIFRLVQLDDEGLEEDIEVCRIIQGNATCHVGFLQHTYVAHFKRYHGCFAQVREIWSSTDEIATQ